MVSRMEKNIAYDAGGVLSVDIAEQAVPFLLVISTVGAAGCCPACRTGHRSDRSSWIAFKIRRVNGHGIHGAVDPNVIREDFSFVKDINFTLGYGLVSLLELSIRYLQEKNWICNSPGSKSLRNRKTKCRKRKGNGRQSSERQRNIINARSNGCH